MQQTLTTDGYIDPKEIVKVEPVTKYSHSRQIPMPVQMHGRVVNRGGFYLYYQQPHIITVNGWSDSESVQAVNRWVDEYLAELWPNGTSPWRPRQPAKYQEVPSPTFPDPTYIDLTRSYKRGN